MPQVMQVRIPVDLHRMAKVMAAQERCTMAEIIERLLREALERKKEAQ